MNYTQASSYYYFDSRWVAQFHRRRDPNIPVMLCVPRQPSRLLSLSLFRGLTSIGQKRSRHRDSVYSCILIPISPVHNFLLCTPARNRCRIKDN